MQSEVLRYFEVLNKTFEPCSGKTLQAEWTLQLKLVSWAFCKSITSRAKFLLPWAPLQNLNRHKMDVI